MDLKFTFPERAHATSANAPAFASHAVPHTAAAHGAERGVDHDHGEAPAGRALPLSTSPGSGGTELTIEVRLTEDALLAEALSGAGVSYAKAQLPRPNDGPEPLARAVRSAISRVVAELADPLVDAVGALTLDLGGSERAVLETYGIDPAAPAVSEALQRRVGVSAGTPIRIVPG